MVDIFTEIQEDLRRDRMVAFWSRWGNWLVGGLAAVFIVAIAFIVWREWQARQNAASSVAYGQAIEVAQAGDVEKALKDLEALRNNGGYGVLARLRAGAILAEKGDKAAAMTVYDSLSKDSSADPVYRDLATVRFVMLQVDDGQPAELMARLAPLMAQGSAWRPSATELTALLEKRAGNVDRARDLYKQLSEDPATPPSLRQRAGEMLATFGTKAG